MSSIRFMNYAGSRSFVCPALVWVVFFSVVFLLDFHLQTDLMGSSKFSSLQNAILPMKVTRTYEAQPLVVDTVQNESGLDKRTETSASYLYRIPHAGAYPDTFAKVPNGTSCFLWEEDMDHWWTHHPLWSVSLENDTHTCFQYNEAYYPLSLQLYKNQFMSDCTNVTTRYMYDSGWGADLEWGVAIPLLEAFRSRNPLSIRTYNGSWHYAAMKPNASNPACAAMDMSCYFLNLTNCKPAENRDHVTTDYFPVNLGDHLRLRGVAYSFVTRQQQWLRRAVYENGKAMKRRIQTPCVAMHVRRGDVVLHQHIARRYYPISSYVAKLPRKRRRNMFLLTDDANAIDEALDFFPNIHWFYLNRTRFRGASGGWENQIPSKNPKSEVITLLTALRLVRACDTIVLGQSAFAELLVDSMRDAWKNDFHLFRVDEGVQDSTNSNNSDSDKKLEQMLEKERKKKGLRSRVPSES